jgi:hypothetical protein
LILRNERKGKRSSIKEHHRDGSPGFFRHHEKEKPHQNCPLGLEDFVLFYRNIFMYNGNIINKRSALTLLPATSTVRVVVVK